MYEMSFLSLSVLLLCLEIWSSLLHSQKFPIDCDPQSMLEGTVMGLVKNFQRIMRPIIFMVNLEIASYMRCIYV